MLLNNGMMWFDPEPGRPNSVAGGKRPLTSMAPAILARGTVVLGLPRRQRWPRMNCNAQLMMNLTDWRLSRNPHSAPRIDRLTADLLMSWRAQPRRSRHFAAWGTGSVSATSVSSPMDSPHQRRFGTSQMASSTAALIRPTPRPRRSGGRVLGAVVGVTMGS